MMHFWDFIMDFFIDMYIECSYSFADFDLHIFPLRAPLFTALPSVALVSSL